MVLVTSSQASADDDETDWLDFVDAPAENPQYTAAKTEGSEILLAPKLAHGSTDGEANSVEYGQLTGGNQKVLNSIEQAIILAMGVDVKKSNPDDELRSMFSAALFLLLHKKTNSFVSIYLSDQYIDLRFL